MPLDAPVTIATFSDSLLIIRHFNVIRLPENLLSHDHGLLLLLARGIARAMALIVSPPHAPWFSECYLEYPNLFVSTFILFDWPRAGDEDIHKPPGALLPFGGRRHVGDADKSPK